MSGPLLAGLGLGVSFGETAALEDVSLSLSAGEVVAVMGTSGSGKSTLLHCLAGVLVPDRGEVSFAGERIDNQSDRRRSDLRLRSFGFVPQFGDLVPELTLLENVALPLRLLQVGRREATGRAAALLDELEVGSAASRRAGAASGGQVQRAAVAREPAGTTRLVAALLVALFVVAGGRCVLVAFETTPQYQRAALAASTGPQLAQLDVPEGSSLNAGVLADIPGVRAVVPGRQVGTECTPEDLRGFPPGADRPSTCGEAFVGTCAQLAFFSHQITGCRDDQAAWLDPGYGEDFSEQVTVTLLSQPTYAADGREIPGPGGPLRLDGLGTISIAPSPDDPNWRPQAQLFVPVTTPGLSTLLAPARTWLVALEGGDAPVRALAAAVPDNVIVYPDDRTDLQTVQGYRYVLYAVAGVVLILGLLALLISGIDRAVERRRHLAALTVLGVPARVVRSSQLLQAAAPLVVGLPLAGGSGLLAGAAYLNLIGARAATPWPAIVALVLGALAAGALVAAATVAGLGGRVQPQDLRQE